MRQLLAFGICFILFIGLWERHYRFFRRFGLEDGATLILNGALLFVVLCYVYPLKFLFTLFIEGIVFGRQTVSIEVGQTSTVRHLRRRGRRGVPVLRPPLPPRPPPAR